MSMSDHPSVADELLLESLPFELRDAVRRLFQSRGSQWDQLDAAYARGYRQGINMGKAEMRNEINRCEACKYRLCSKHSRFGPDA